MDDTVVPRDAAELSEALYNARIESQSAGEQYSSQGAEYNGSQSAFYNISYNIFYNISVPCFSSLLSQYQSRNGCSGRTFILRYLFFWVWEQLPATGFAFI